MWESGLNYCAYLNERTRFLMKLKASIIARENLIVPSNHKEWLTETLCGLVHEFWPDCDMLLMVSGSDVVPAEQWMDYNIVAYSPIIVAGLDCQNRFGHFDKIYGWFINSSSPAAQAAQMLLRARKTSTNTIQICVTNCGKRSDQWYASGVEKRIIQYQCID
eukprot:22579_1